MAVKPGDIISSVNYKEEFSLPLGTILIWKDSSHPEFILCHSENQVPGKWLREKTPLKIVGEFNFIKKIIPKFVIPSGSKVVGLSGSAIIRIDLSHKLFQFSGKRQKRIVIVDDSGTMRKLLKHVISQFENWEVVGEAAEAEGIPALIEEFYPDLVTLDLNLGATNGAVAMKRYLAPRKIPTLLITSQAMNDGGLVMEALSAGALDYLQKPESGKWDTHKEEMHLKMEAALKSKWQEPTSSALNPQGQLTSFQNAEDFLIVIGSSTGGTQALENIFTRLPANIPPILVTQHIPAGFSRALAERLNSLCAFEIKEANDGDEVRPGRVLIAPGDHHMRLRKGGKNVEIISAPPVNRFRPSVEVMFQSVAENAKCKVIATMLTGMGKDGAEAMLGLKNNGAITVAQDEASSVVFGMPKEAIRIGAADHIRPLSEMPEFFLSMMKKKKSA